MLRVRCSHGHRSVVQLPGDANAPPKERAGLRSGQVRGARLQVARLPARRLPVRPSPTTTPVAPNVTLVAYALQFLRGEALHV